MVNLLLGGSGSGKTVRILEMMRECFENTDRDMVLIVPEYQSALWDSKTSEMFPPSVNLRLTRTTFRRLPDDVYREFGGIADKVIDEGGRLLLVWRALMSVRDHLRIAVSRYEDKYLRGFLMAIDELKASGISPSAASSALERLEVRRNGGDGTADSVTDRLHDVTLVYGAYETILKHDYVDRSDILTELAASLEDNRFFEGKDVFIDSGYRYSRPEMKIISKIIEQAENVSMTFPCPPWTDDSKRSAEAEIQFVLPYRFEKEVERICDELGVQHRIFGFLGDCRHAAPEMRLVEKYIFNYADDPTEDHDFKRSETEKASDHIRIVECGDVFDEAEACAAIIESLLREGYKNSEIAVLASDIKSREGVIDSVLRKHGLSCFLSEPEKVSSSPAVRVILMALKVIYNGWQGQDVIRLLKTGMVPTEASGHADDGESDAELFETYLNTWQIGGYTKFTGGDWKMNPRGLSGGSDEGSSSELSRINGLKNTIVPPLKKLAAIFEKGQAGARAISESLVYMMEEYGVRDRLIALAGEYRKLGMDGEAELTEKGWSAVCEVFDKMVSFLGDEKMRAVNYAGLFARVAETMDRSTIPTGMDEIILDSASGLGFGDVKCTVILGSNVGEFPASVEDTRFFREKDRKTLREAGLDIDTDDILPEISGEYFKYYRAAVSPSEKLFILYSGSGGSGMSDGARNIIDLLAKENTTCHVRFADLPLEKTVFSPAGAEYQYSRRAGTPEAAALRGIFSDRAGFDVPLTAENDTLSPKEHNSLDLSITQMEAFDDCRFKYSCNYVLGLKDLPRSDFGSLETGNFVHHVLEEFFRSFDARDRRWNDTGEITRETDRIIDGYMAKVAESAGIETDDGRIGYMFGRLRRFTPVYIRRIIEELKATSYVPLGTEMTIGDSGDVKPVVYRTEKGNTLRVPGKIDRADVYDDGNGHRMARVIDYKTGSKKNYKFSEDLKTGNDMQLPMYLFTLCSDPAVGKDLTPAGAAYLFVDHKVSPNERMLSPEEAEEKLSENISWNGFTSGGSPESHKGVRELSDGEMEKLRETMMAKAAEYADGISAGEAQACHDREICKYCSYRYVCKVRGTEDD